jgi:hypothetical protein
LSSCHHVRNGLLIVFAPPNDSAAIPQLKSASEGAALWQDWGNKVCAKADLAVNPGNWQFQRRVSHVFRLPHFATFPLGGAIRFGLSGSCDIFLLSGLTGPYAARIQRHLSGAGSRTSAVLNAAGKQA